ncbi:hypothetical protein [uncultured Microbacterium sp.]|uniref:hypothetical protein n=1 Tax=uncultured Microbacterium sp. TaxID=191216 RepID=UPI0025D0F8FF|nr:hypothetical protein [uncultured Microbacterium sp.]
MSYANGQYPLHLFIHRGGNLYFTPSLNARWDEMVRLALEKYGVRLYITGDIDGLGGWNVYRPIGPQRNYRRHYGIRAAEPGKSSHGGKYRGQEVFAADIANVDSLAPGNPSLARARLTALAKAVGLTVNFVTPTEWWHVGDFNPAWAAPSFGAVAINPGTTNRPAPISKEDDDMQTIKWGEHIFTLERSYLKYETNPKQAAIMGWLFNRNDRMAPESTLIGVNNNDVNALQKTLSIPWYAFELVMSGRGYNIDGTRGDGQGENGRVWSLQHEINAKLDGIRLDTTGLAKTFDELQKKIKG